MLYTHVGRLKEGAGVVSFLFRKDDWPSGDVGDRNEDEDEGRDR